MQDGDLDLPIALSTLGSAAGEPAVLLPGGPCRGPEYLGNLAGVGDERTLVVAHPRGTPRSGGHSRGWWADADDVVALIDALGLDAADIVAHSAGTRLALATAARFPSRVRSLALITPPASWLTQTPSDAEEIAASLAGPEAREACAALADDGDGTEAGFRAALRRQAPAGYARWGAPERTHAEVGAVSLTAAIAWFMDIPVEAPARIRAMAKPRALVLGGDRDLLTGVQPVREYAAILGAELELLTDCGHYPWVEQPAAFRRVLGAWLRLPR